MSDLGDLLELLHSARGNYQSARATVRRRRDETLCWQAASGQQAAAPASSDTKDEKERAGSPTPETTSRFWVVWPARVRCERQLELKGQPRVVLTVGDGERWWYRDPRFGVEPLDEQLVRVELPELNLFDPWQLASDLELKAARRTTCAGRPAVAALATARRPTSPPVPGAERYELAVDAERGVILKLAALFDGKPLQVYEVVDISFDEELDPELFRLEGATERKRSPTADSRRVELQCSFCGRSQRMVMKLIAGPGVYVCDECIDLCNEIIDEERKVRGR